MEMVVGVGLEVWQCDWVKVEDGDGDGTDLFWNQICNVFGLTSGPSFLAKDPLAAASGFL